MSKKDDSKEDAKQQGGTFEERLQRLEQLSEEIREGDVSLDTAVKQFEEGIKLAKGLEKELSRVERKVEILINEPDEEGDEKPVLELFPELADVNAGKGRDESEQ